MKKSPFIIYLIGAATLGVSCESINQATKTSNSAAKPAVTQKADSGKAKPEPAKKAPDAGKKEMKKTNSFCYEEKQLFYFLEQFL